MNIENQKLIYYYLENFIIQQNKHNNFIDYYELFGLDNEMSIEEINQQIKSKKIRILFHPDQEGYIQENMKQYFREFVKLVISVNDVFSNLNSKEQYDEKLIIDKENYRLKEEEYKRKCKEKTPRKSLDFAKVFSFFKSSEVDNSSDSKNFERVIETVIYVGGFFQGYKEIKKAAHGDFTTITKENNARSIAKKIGDTKIKKILYNNKRDTTSTKSANNIFMDYFCNVIDKSGLKEKADSFYNLCFQTIKNYGAFNDQIRLELAITNYINSNSTKLFSYDSSLSDFLDNNFSCDDIDILMCAKLHNYSENDSKVCMKNLMKMDIEDRINCFSTLMHYEVQKSISAQK